MDFRPRPIFFKRHAGHFLIGNECKRAVRSVLDHVSQVDEIEDAPDRRCIEGIVGSTEHGLCHQLAIVVVLGEQASRVLRKPLQWVPVLVAFGGVHAAAVAEARHPDHMPFDRRERGS